MPASFFVFFPSYCIFMLAYAFSVVYPPLRVERCLFKHVNDVSITNYVPRADQCSNLAILMISGTALDAITFQRL